VFLFNKKKKENEEKSCVFQQDQLAATQLASRLVCQLNRAQLATAAGEQQIKRGAHQVSAAS
jgi:hypothetical protein